MTGRTDNTDREDMRRRRDAGKSLAEIAEIYGISPLSVGTHLHRLRKAEKANALQSATPVRGDTERSAP